MNKKMSQALKRGKAFAVPLCIKGKELALAGYVKGNELMDKVGLLRNPIHKKIVWGAIGLVVLWLIIPSGGSGDSRGKSNANGKIKGLVFKESDFKKESPSDKMFYVKNGKDDGYKEVVPNLKRIPKSLSIETLCASFNPELESFRHQKGMAYFNQEDGTAYHCIVVHVGNGYVIAEPDSKTMYGDFYGYIETDDDYVEGQILKTGFYAFTGRKTVPLANGSSRSMYSFAKIDAASNKLAVDAVFYNAEAIEATRTENARRDEAKRQDNTNAYNDAVYKALAKESKRFKVRPITEQIHLPLDLKEKKGVFTIEEDAALNYNVNGPTEVKEIQPLFEKKNWSELVKQAWEHRDGISPDEEARRVVDHFLNWKRKVRCLDKALVSEIEKYVLVSVVPGQDKAEKKEVDPEPGYGFSMSIMLCEDVYIVRRNDKDLLELIDEPSRFIAAFTNIHGK